ncbi:hypothetical protein CFC21_065898 [Triticum aestivum]|uniref:Uncharacterized protein n=2 Tax=Triticum aestivum TaxID=4565 RepID=A0A3B6KIQ4_WHEAT|nr:hypothetical protein CFC21_065898 [Triticum aestivum]
MDLDTENRLASLLLEEARRLQSEADREGVHAYLQKPNVRHRPNSRFLTATVRGVQQDGLKATSPSSNAILSPSKIKLSSLRLKQTLRAVAHQQSPTEVTMTRTPHGRLPFSCPTEHDTSIRMPNKSTFNTAQYFPANRVVEVDEMWRAREKELELESKLKRRNKERGDSRGEKRKGDSRNMSSSSKIEEGTAYNSSYSDQDDGLGDDEVEKFLHSRVKRGRGAVGSRMDEPGPYLKDSSHCRDKEPSPDIRLEEKWERRVQGPERPLFLRSKSLDDCWHGETLDDNKPSSSSEAHRKKENKKERRSEKKERKDKKKAKHRHRHHHHKSRRRE